MDLRIEGVGRGPRVTITVDAEPVAAHQGESLAAALLAAGVARFRDSPRLGAPRGPFCFMGVCQECVVRVDGATVQACLVPVRAGMEVRLVGSSAP